MTQAQVEAVNKRLLEGEPSNVSLDEHSGYTGYRPQAIVDAMNECFGIGAWGFEEVSSEIVSGDKGGLAIAQVSVWLKDVDFKPTSWGQNRVTRGDIGDAKKGAQTDAIKKALSYFSIGNRAYHGLLSAKGHTPAANATRTAPQPANNARVTTTAPTPIGATTVTVPLPSMLRARCRQINKNFDALVRFVLKDAVSDEDLTPDQCHQLNTTLKQWEQTAKVKAS